MLLWLEVHKSKPYLSYISYKLLLSSHHYYILQYVVGLEDRATKQGKARELTVVRFAKQIAYHIWNMPGIFSLAEHVRGS